MQQTARKFSTNIKRTRKWGKDEILTVGTWLIVGTGAFVLIGTTTSASVALLLANSLQFQGNKKANNYYDNCSYGNVLNFNLFL